MEQTARGSIPRAVAAGDRFGDASVTTDARGKPAVLRRATLRLLAVACLALIAYGTLGPLPLGGQPWICPVEHWRWRPPIERTEANDVIANFSVFVPVGVAFRLLVRRRGWAGPLDFGVGLALSVLLSYTSEVCQQAMPARSSSLTDVYVNTAGATVGCLGAVLAQAAIRRFHATIFAFMQGCRRIGRGTWHRPIVLGVSVLAFGTLSGIALHATRHNLNHRDYWSMPRADPLLHWAPFQGEFTHAFPSAAARGLGQVATYALVTLLCCLLARGRGRSVALLLLLGWVGVWELCKACAGRWGADTTPFILALSGWLSAARVWIALQPRLPAARPGAATPAPR